MSLFYDDMMEQPEALEQLLKNQKNITKRADVVFQNFEKSKLLLTGMGSSYHASEYAAVYLREHGMCAQVEELSELLLYYSPELLKSYDKIIILSQSGETAELKSFINKYPYLREKYVFVTNNKNSSSINFFEEKNVFLLEAGEEKALGSTKSFINSVMLLLIIADHFFNKKTDFEKVLAELNKALKSDMSAHENFLQENKEILIISRGYGVAISKMAKLTFAEISKLPCVVFSGAGFRHGPLELLYNNPNIIFIGMLGKSYKLIIKLYEDIKDNANKLLITNSSSFNNSIKVGGELPEFLSFLISIVVFQNMAENIAKYRGFEAGKGFFASKITEEE